MGNQWLLDHRAQDEGGCWMVIHGVGWGGVLTSLVRTSNYVTDFFGIPTTLLSSLSTSNYASISCKLCFHYVVFSLSTSNYVSIPCKTSSKYVVIFSINFQLRWKLMWPNWCDQTDVTKLMSPALQKRIAAVMCKNYGPTGASLSLFEMMPPK